MGGFHEIFEVAVSDDQLQAVLKQHSPLPEGITENELISFLKECGVSYGILRDTVSQIAAGNKELPAVVAEGKPPVNGEDAYIHSILDDIRRETDRCDEHDPDGDVDLKKVIDIPSVEAGTTVGRKVERTEAVNGMTIQGEEIPAKPGRDIKLRPGKNTRVEGIEIIATTDGQVSVEPKVIHVFPVFEVNGDLDLKTGNIDFIGNVNIRGNVPSGFEVKSRGDIRIHGTVESANLSACGSIYIHQGVVAQGTGLIQAGGDLHTSFLNQANIEAGGDVHVTKSILQSQIEARGYVFCKQGRGNIVGGSVSAGKGIDVNEAGNHMSTPTTFYLGISEKAVAAEKKYKAQLSDAQETTQKLAVLLKKLLEKEHSAGLSTKEKITKLRIKNSLQEANNLLSEAKDELMDLHDTFENQYNAQIRINKTIYPNSHLHFGKYQRKIVTKYDHVSFKIDRCEIKFEPL